MIMIVKEKRFKSPKQTVAQILRKAYIRHCHDRETMAAVRQHLRNPHREN